LTNGVLILRCARKGASKEGRQFEPSLNEEDLPMIALRFEVPASARETAERCCDNWGESLSLIERAGGASWALEVLFAAAPDEAAIRDRLTPVGVIDWRLEPVAERDWVRESQRLLPEFSAGRFFIYGSHFDGALPASVWPLKIDAGTAFGTGRHQTTLGCSWRSNACAAVVVLCPSSIWVRAPAFLALAAARTGAGRVLAVDNDPVAVQVTRENARINGVASRLRPAGGEGYRRRPLARTRQRFDLVLANILSRPLQRMAPDLKRVLRPGGARDSFWPASPAGSGSHRCSPGARAGIGGAPGAREWSVLQFKRKTGGR
jgi:ribosomal protein L11 methyltransferase